MKRSLGVDLTIFFLLVALLPFVISSFIFYYQAKENAIKEIRDNLSSLCTQVGREVDKVVHHCMAHVEALAKSPIITSENTPLEEKLSEMKKSVEFFEMFDDITLINLDGVVMASTSYDFRGDWKHKEWFKKARAGSMAISPLYTLLNPLRFVIICTSPVKGEDGKVRAVISGRIDISTIWEITDAVGVGYTGFIFLIGKAGNLVAWPKKQKVLFKIKPDFLRERILEAKKGMIRYIDIDGKARVCYYRTLGGYRGYKGQGWKIGVIQDTEELLSTLTELRNKIIFAAVFGCLIILLLSVLLTRNILRPINSLVYATDKIAKGDLDYRVKVYSHDELGILANAFNKMTEELRDYQSNLEQKVSDRTKAIEKEIEARKVVEECLLKNEANFRATVLNLPLAVFLLDKSGEFVLSEGRGLDTLEILPEKVVGESYRDTFAGKFIVETIQNALDGQNSASTFESKDRIFNIRCSPVFNEAKEVDGMLGVCIDITERIKSERALRESEDKFRSIFEQAADSILLIDTDTGEFVEFNDKAHNNLGYAREEFKNLRLSDFEVTESVENINKRITKIINEGSDLFETQHRKKDGQVRDVRVSARAVLIGGHNYISTIWQDITNQKIAQKQLQEAYDQLRQTQSQLLQMEKFSAMGQFAGGIAHEIKNPLGIILQGIYFLENKLPPEDKEFSKVLGMIKDSVLRSDNIIRSLINFSKETEINLSPQDINTILEASLALSKQRLKFRENVKVVKELGSDIPKVLADKPRLEQVFINLLLNSIQAMPPEGGVITLRSYLGGIEGVVSKKLKPGEQMVIVEVEDTGVGISENDLEKIRDPFFSTKGPKGGTGLGLSVSQNVIDMHKGFMDIESKEGQGTKITIVLKKA